MYSTCIFCHGSLGRNEALERFQVGRRLAYDSAKGRLWVICPHCERWNLSPLESRWEAIEDAERSFGKARLRSATENVGLVRLKDGLDLVRIGVPPRLEFASWRYGDQFGRRRLKYLGYLGVGTAASALPLLGSLGIGAAIVGVAGLLGYTALDMRKFRRDTAEPTIFLRDDDDSILPLTKQDSWTAALAPTPSMRDWYLSVRHRVRVSGSSAASPFRGFHPGQASEPAILSGRAAYRALAALLPHANPVGAGTRGIREAVGVIEGSRTLEELTRDVALAARSSTGSPPRSPLTRLPARVRLAMEMLVHEDEERRALQGELAELDRRWREADEIANIADSLLLPADIEARIMDLKKDPR